MWRLWLGGGSVFARLLPFLIYMIIIGVEIRSTKWNQNVENSSVRVAVSAGGGGGGSRSRLGFITINVTCLKKDLRMNSVCEETKWSSLNRKLNISSDLWCFLQSFSSHPFYMNKLFSYFVCLKELRCKKQEGLFCFISAPLRTTWASCSKFWPFLFNFD